MKQDIKEYEISDHNLKAEKRTKEEIAEFNRILGEAAFPDKVLDAKE